MEYHALILKHDAIVKPAMDGINDTEWEHGVRIYSSTITSRHNLIRTLEVQGFDVLDADNWNKLISSLDDPSIVPNNNFLYPHRTDKWDKKPEIY